MDSNSKEKSKRKKRKSDVVGVPANSSTDENEWLIRGTLATQTIKKDHKVFISHANVNPEAILSLGTVALTQPVKKDHKVFISHVKGEIGEVAGSFQEWMVPRFNNGAGSVFLDAQKGFKLDELCDRVRASSVFLVLLSRGYFTRPFCLTEIITAHKAGLKIFVVNVANVAFDYSSPISMNRSDSSVIHGLLDEKGWKALSAQGYNLEDTQQAIQWCLNYKGLEYHPLSPMEVREAERKLIFDEIVPLTMADTEMRLQKLKNQRNVMELVSLWKAKPSLGLAICKSLGELTDQDHRVRAMFGLYGGCEVLVQGNSNSSRYD